MFGRNLIERVRDVTERKSRRTFLKEGVIASLSLVLACGVQRPGESLSQPPGNPVVKELPPRPAQKPPFRRGIDQIPIEPGTKKPYLRIG